jgi:hypothetical protein
LMWGSRNSSEGSTVSLSNLWVVWARAGIKCGGGCPSFNPCCGPQGHPHSLLPWDGLGKAGIKCLFLGGVVMATTGDQAREKPTPAVHWL